MFSNHSTRRQFLGTASALAGVALAPHRFRAAPAADAAFSFVLLGDVHYDKAEHHDFVWAKQTKSTTANSPGFVQKTREILPPLFASVRDTIADLNRNPATRVAFVLQVGDLVQGACGNEELATRQNSDALQFVGEAALGVPFLFTKGNHDVSGPGAKEAFASVFHPFLNAQAHAVSPAIADIKSGRYTVERGNAQFAFFDAYDLAASLDWFEAVAARRTAENFFLVIHPPVVPYGARSTWTIYSSEKDRPKREKLMAMLGEHRAFVLSGHLHRYCSLGRQTPRGRFAQFALSSVIYGPDVQPALELSGLENYSGDQVRVEPRFSPETEALRRELFELERPSITAFEFADLPGYAVVTVDGPRVRATMFRGITRDVWRTVDLSGLLG
ncbi:MAG: metallophosphoesterase [Opitutaceae bacterium]|nr:metallophosphoesterase [Opitutaceae bacterium]